MNMSQSRNGLLLMAGYAVLSVLLSATPASASTSTAASDSATSIFDSVDGVSFGGGLLAVLAMLGGLAACLAGFHLFRLTLFAVGFVAGGTLLATVAEFTFADKAWLLTASWVAFVVGGLLCGLLVFRIYTLGLFVAGASGGVLLAVLINTSFGYKVAPGNPEIALLILAIVLGILGGLLAICLERPVLIAATSFVGSGLLVWGIGYFAGDYPSATDLKRYRSSSADGDGYGYAIPGAWWGYLCATLVIGCVGVLVQVKLTGRGSNGENGGGDGDHAPVVVSRKEVVIFARHREVVEVGTPTTSDSRSGYTIV
ncbi:hypothetical protein Gpo141_00009373 [Globisporangium polare]